MDRAVRITKRLTDIVGATLGLAVTLPFYPLIAAAIYLESPGPVILRQRRAGGLRDPDPDQLDGIPRPRFHTFTMFKFRSMRPEAEVLTGPVFATRGDARTTRVGRVLRRTRLDEVPQFFNVLIGEMSLVGPRPERPELAEQLAMAIPYFEERTRDVKPGITGLAQISLGYTGKPLPESVLAPFESGMTNPFKVEGAEDSLADHMRMKLLYDLAYSAATEDFRAFLSMELSILLKTPLVMLLAKGT